MININYDRMSLKGSFKCKACGEIFFDKEKRREHQNICVNKDRVVKKMITVFFTPYILKKLAGRIKAGEFTTRSEAIRYYVRKGLEGD